MTTFCRMRFTTVFMCSSCMEFDFRKCNKKNSNDCDIRSYFLIGINFSNTLQKAENKQLETI